MTIKEMIKKIDGFNEVSRHLDKTVAVLEFVDSMPLRSEQVKDYKEFARFIRKTYISEVADAILSYKDYEFEKPYEIAVAGRFGDELKETAMFYVNYAF